MTRRSVRHPALSAWETASTLGLPPTMVLNTGLKTLGFVHSVSALPKKSMNVSISSQWIHLYLTQARFCSWLLATLIQTRTNTNIKLCACTELILSGETLGKSQQLRWTQPSKTLQKEDRRMGGHALQCNGPEAEEQTAGLDAMKNTKKEMGQRGDRDQCTERDWACACACPACH